MAGDWLQIDCDLPEKRETVNICCKTGLPLDVVCGRLILFWRWIDRQFTSAKMCGASVRTLTQVVGGDEKFWETVAEENWLVIENDGLVIPGWKRRFHKSSKSRILKARRMSRLRGAGVAQQRHGSATGAPPKEEKRREEKSKEENISKNTNSKAKFVPPTIEEVRAYCTERANAVDAQQFVNHYESKGWLVGKTPMRDWQAAVRTWETNQSTFQGGNHHARGSTQTTADRDNRAGRERSL